MANGIVIYGTNLEAEQLYSCILSDGNDVEFFIVDNAFKKTDQLMNRKVISSETFFKEMNYKNYEVLLSFGYKNMVKERQRIFEECVEKGVTLASYISKNAVVLAKRIGEGCIILPSSIIAPHVVIGKGTFIEIGCKIAHHTRIGEFCFLAPGVTICGNTSVGNNCFIGANATLVNNIIIEDEVLIAAGAIVNKNRAKKDVVYAAKGLAKSNHSENVVI